MQIDLSLCRRSSKLHPLLRISWLFFQWWSGCFLWMCFPCFFCEVEPSALKSKMRMINSCAPNFTCVGDISKILTGSYEMFHTLTDCCFYCNLSPVPHVLKVFKDGGFPGRSSVFLQWWTAKNKLQKTASSGIGVIECIWTVLWQLHLSPSLSIYDRLPTPQRAMFPVGL